MEAQFSGPVGNGRPFHPWQQYTTRNENLHRAEDSRLFPSQDVPSTSVIDEFIPHDSDELELSIPRRHQCMRDFLSEAVTSPSRSLLPSHYIEHDIAISSKSRDIALVDDRCNNSRSSEQWDGDKYKGHVVISEKQAIPQFYEYLKANRFTNTHRSEKRIAYLPNPTSAAALALASTAPKRTATPLRNFLRRYLLRENLLGLTTLTWGFILEFHIPYYAMRCGPKLKDHRQLRGKSLRESVELPLRSWSLNKEKVFYHEAQISGLIIGPDEWVWTTYLFLDTFFRSEDRLKDYLENCNLGEGFDPPLGGISKMDNPHFNPRQYFLAILDRRIMQASVEWTVLIETFDERMVAYAKAMSKIPEDDSDRTHTVTLNEVIRTIQRFRGGLYATVEAWKSFKNSRMPYFTTNGILPTKWQGYFEKIEDHVTQLDRLNQGCSNKLDLFREIQAGLSRASSLKESAAATQTARSALLQGENIRLLTRMTVYIYLPVMFTLAFFSMPFAHPPHPWTWPIFSLILLAAIMINYVIASDRCCVRRVIRRRVRSLSCTSTV
ncbi:hypothetical protein BU16DRAFT_526627 [Lophium mytilinum]|uniref:Uncharacterized protein n=1 Tax=Lophium mytilinum TaxID=390894 RepID=A0A6A6QV82_9PEZI|nr:hypothetical protein BU16DRAFT_526627 [Lophium mytilinum]